MKVRAPGATLNLLEKQSEGQADGPQGPRAGSLVGGESVGRWAV